MYIPTSKDIRTVTDLREQTVNLLNSLQKRTKPTIITHRNQPKAVMLSITHYNKIMEALEDISDEIEAKELENEPINPKDYTPIKEVIKNL